MRTATTNDDEMYRLTRGNVSTIDGPQVNITLSLDDLNELKARTTLALSVNTTYLVVISDGVRDVSDNSIRMIPAASAVEAGQVLPDVTSPDLVRYELDLNSGALILSFTETVNSSSLNIAGVTIQSVQNLQISRNADNRFLQPPLSVTPDYGPVVTVILSLDDFYYFQQTPSIGTTENNTYLTISQGAISDTSMNPFPGITIDDARQAFDIIEDINPPDLVSFDFNLNSSQLLLTFDEVVFSDTVNPRLFTIQGRQTGGARYTLTNSSVITTNNITVLIDLSNFDLNMIKSMPDLAVSNETTFISFGSSALMDTSRNNATAISSANAMQVNEFIPDTTPPVLIGFDLLTSGSSFLIRLRFSETVNGSTLDLSGISLISQPLLNVTAYVIQSAILQAPFITDQVTVLSNVTDVEGILLLPPLGQTLDDSYMVLPPMAVVDMSGNSFVGLTSEQAVMATVIDIDLVPPSLVEFSLDLTAGNLQLTFDEPVGILDLQQVTIQGNETNGVPNVTLTGGNFTALTSAMDIFVVVLTSDDLNALKSDENLAVSSATTFVSLNRGLAVDLGASIENNAIPPSMALPAGEFIPDRVRPSLRNFTLNLNLNTIILTFSEAVNSSSLNPALIAIQSSESNPQATVQLTDGELLTTTPSNIVEFELSIQDSNALRQNTEVVLDIFTTYITIASDGIYDMNGNRLFPVTSIRALRAMEFIGDEMRPMLVNYTFDLSSEQLILTFDETVNASTINIGEFTLVNSMYGFTVNVTLNDSEAILVNSAMITIQLGLSDATMIKTSPLCEHSNAMDCFLMFTENSTRDMVGHGVYAFGPTEPVIFINDTRRPELSEFVEFNLLTGQISLRFTEAMDNSLFNFTAITLLSLFERPLQSYTLTDGEVINIIDNTVAVIQLSTVDLVAVQRMIHICTYRGNCYIVVSRELVTDTSGNQVVAIDMAPPGRIVTSFIDDNLPPELLSATLNLNDSTLVMTFNEAVQASSVSTNGITLLETMNPSDSNFSYTLTGGSPRAINATVVEIRLTNDDISSIKDMGYGSNLVDCIPHLGI